MLYCNGFGSEVATPAEEMTKDQAPMTNAQ